MATNWASPYRQGPLYLYGEFSYVQTYAQNIDSFENEFPDNELAYLVSHHFQLDHQGRYTSSAGVAYTFLRDTRLHADYLYENGLRAGFANDVKLATLLDRRLGGTCVACAHVRRRAGQARVDCLNVFNNVGEIRNGTGIGIAALAYVPPAASTLESRQSFSGYHDAPRRGRAGQHSSA